MPNEGTASYQRILGHLRRAVTDYHMLSPGDHIAVGVSGGSDSMVLLLGLGRQKRLLPLRPYAPRRTDPGGGKAGVQ